MWTFIFLAINGNNIYTTSRQNRGSRTITCVYRNQKSLPVTKWGRLMHKIVSTCKLFCKLIFTFSLKKYLFVFFWVINRFTLFLRLSGLRCHFLILGVAVLTFGVAALKFYLHIYLFIYYCRKRRNTVLQYA